MMLRICLILHFLPSLLHHFPLVMLQYNVVINQRAYNSKTVSTKNIMWLSVFYTINFSFDIESCNDTVVDSFELLSLPSNRYKEGIILYGHKFLLIVHTSFTPILTLLDFTSLPDVEHHFIDLIKWEDENGVKRELRVYSKIAHKWRQIASRLGFELGEIESVKENYHRNDSRITTVTVLRRWFENARSLPNAGRYPKGAGI